jgi:hypothetical protein
MSLTTKIVLEDDGADTFPGLVLGISSIFTTCWWVALMFIYVRNHSREDNLKNRNNEEVFPIAFFWERILEETDIY